MIKRALKNQSWPAEPWEIRVVGIIPRIFDANNVDITNHSDAQARIIQCVNACKKIWAPENHIPESNAYYERAEALRRDAVAELERVAA